MTKTKSHAHKGHLFDIAKLPDDGIRVDYAGREDECGDAIEPAGNLTATIAPTHYGSYAVHANTWVQIPTSFPTAQQALDVVCDQLIINAHFTAAKLTGAAQLSDLFARL